MNSLTSASKMAAHSAAETALLARVLALERIVNTGGTGTITFVNCDPNLLNSPRAGQTTTTPRN
jgi:hypothetical protein